MTANKKDLYNLADGWLELESDPGLFTLLMEDMGVQGVQVEEIYDLQREPLVEKKPCYGAIFLFRWIEDRRSRRKIVEEDDLYVKNEEEVNKIFFAQQMIPNSCATHALVSILLNCPQLHLGDTLSSLRNHVAGMNPENKGLAIGNCAQLAQAHNSHAVPRARRRFEKGNGLPSTGSRYTGEAFHFVSYVPINNRLMELDGLRKYPIDHGPIPDPDNWTEKLREVITARLGIPQGDIRFALMALVPDSRVSFQKKLRMLRTNREIVIKALRQLLQLYWDKKMAQEEAGVKSRRTSKDNRTTNPTLFVEDKDAEVDEEDCMVVSDNGATEEVKKLEADVLQAINEDADLIASVNTLRPPQSAAAAIKNKPLLRLSRGSSFDSQPKSPFQSNPLLTAHDYSKSPMMEGFDDVDGVNDLLMTEELEDEDGVQDDEDKDDSKALPENDNGNKSEELDRTDQERTEEGKGSCNTRTSDGDDAMKTEAAEESENGCGDKIEVTSKAKSENIDEKKVGDKDNLEKPEEKGRQSGAVDEPTEAKEDSSGLESSNSEPTETKIFSLRLEDKKPEFNPQESKLTEPTKFTPKDLLTLLRRVETEIYVTESALKEEVETHKKFIVDDCRRVHNYDEFINTFLSMLAEQNMLADLVEMGMGYRRTVPGSSSVAAADAKKQAAAAEAARKQAASTADTASKQAKKMPVNKGGGAQAKGRKKKKKLEDSDSDWSESDILPPSGKSGVKVLYNDSSLPKGWKRKVKKRAGTGLVNGKYDVNIVNPEGDQFKTKAELRAYLVQQGSELDAEDFDFSVTGTKRTSLKQANKKKK